MRIAALLDDRKMIERIQRHLDLCEEDVRVQGGRYTGLFPTRTPTGTPAARTV